MSHVAAIALGSNLATGGSDREANLRAAVDRVRELGRVVAVSGWYDTTPVGYLDQPRFLNGALLLETELEPLELLRGLLRIELDMGRDRSATVAKGPRVIDLDLLLVGDLVMRTLELTLPHPGMQDRWFVLEPLNEIASGMIDPRTGKTVAEMLGALAATAMTGAGSRLS
jgi:2-amino-4-hydroxy-6-hydroxymethyldihydropteridine diphosphokinase